MSDLNQSKQEVENLTLEELDEVSGGAGSGTACSGSFRSNTGTGLNILVEWNVVAGLLGDKTLEVKVSTWSYSLSNTSLDNGVELHVNGALYLAKSNPIDYRGAEQSANLLASFSIPNLSGTVSLSVVWHFRGSYSGVALNEIRAEGTAIV